MTPLLAGLMLLMIQPAGAKDLSFPMVIGSDDRRIVDSWEPSWNAIGRVNFAGFSRRLHCTGSLVAPRLVVTAAHCLFDAASGKRLGPAGIHFVAGFRRQKSLGQSVARCIRLLDGFHYARKPVAEMAASDVAMLVLKEPIAIRPLPLARDEALRPGLEVVHAGYGRDRPHVLSAHHGCQVTAVSGDLIATDCDTNLGQSGGPLLVEEDGELKLAAVMVGGTGQEINIAASISAWRELLAGDGCGD